MDRLTPDLIRLGGAGPASIHVVAADPITLVDAGAPGRGPAIERELRRIGLAPRRIVLTHGDPDHAGAADYLRAAFSAEVLASDAERGLIDRSAWPSLPARRQLVMRLYYRRQPPPTVDRWLAGGEDLDGLRVVPAPGHTPGSLVFTWADWMLAGDAFVSGQRFGEAPWLFTTDRPRARRSIEALAELGMSYASSSHGRPAPIGDGLRALIASWTTD